MFEEKTLLIEQPRNTSAAELLIEKVMPEQKLHHRIIQNEDLKLQRNKSILRELGIIFILLSESLT